MFKLNTFVRINNNKENDTKTKEVIYDYNEENEINKPKTKIKANKDLKYFFIFFTSKNI